MALTSIALTNTAVKMEDTPFSAGMSGVVLNTTGGTLIVQGSDDGTTGWTTLVSPTTLAVANIPKFPPYMRVSTAATVYILAAM